MSDWPFDDAWNTTSITTRQVLEEKAPILTVSHDDDGDWQFLHVLDGDAPDVEDGRVVALGAVADDLDPSVRALADLPRGWIAWRSGPDSSWQRAQSSD